MTINIITLLKLVLDDKLKNFNDYSVVLSDNKLTIEYETDNETVVECHITMDDGRLTYTIHAYKEREYEVVSIIKKVYTINTIDTINLVVSKIDSINNLF